MDKETTNTQEKYEKLARQLDQFIVGVPFSPTLIEILKILFPDDELEMALEMSFENKTAAQLAGETGEDETTVRERLGRMGSIAVGEDEVAVVGGAACIGCGVCVPSCSTGAAGLIVREKAAPPPDAVQLVTARIKK